MAHTRVEEIIAKPIRFPLDAGIYYVYPTKMLTSFIVYILAFIFLTPGMIVLLPILALRLLQSNKFADELIFGYLRFAFRTLFKIAGVNIEVVGDLPDINNDQPFCLASNHRSGYDGIAILCALPIPFRAIAKKEILLLPILNVWVFASAAIFIGRHNPSKAIKKVRLNFIKSAKTGRSVIVFPEGTRTKDGNLGKFRRGGITMAAEAGFSLLPVAIWGTEKIIGENGRINNCTVKISFGDPLTSESQGRNGMRELLQKIEGNIEEMLEVFTPQS